MASAGSVDQILDLDTSTSSREKIKSHAPADLCVICLEFITERAITVPCNHVNFDFLCLLSWLLDQQSGCPLCKAEVTAVQYEFYSPNDFKTFHIPRKVEVKNSSNLPISQSPRRERRRHRPRTTSLVDDNIALRRRKHIYNHSLYSLHVGANRISRYRNFTPQTFSDSSDLQSRARKWIRRELSVFDFLHLDNTSRGPGTAHASNPEFLLEYIIAILKSVDIKGSSGRAEDLLQEFLGRQHARLFLHELEAWLRSPYTELNDWDRAVQYREELPKAPEQATSSGERRYKSINFNPLRQMPSYPCDRG